MLLNLRKATSSDQWMSTTTSPTYDPSTLPTSRDTLTDWDIRMPTFARDSLINTPQVSHGQMLRGPSDDIPLQDIKR